jgi:hypothetical protein
VLPWLFATIEIVIRFPASLETWNFPDGDWPFGDPSVSQPETIPAKTGSKAAAIIRDDVILMPSLLPTVFGA